MRMRRWHRSLVPRACARAVGTGLGVESSGGAGAVVPPGFGSSFGFRVSDWPIGGDYSTCVQVWSRGSCHFWGGGRDGSASAAPPARPFDPPQRTYSKLRVSGPSAPGMDSGSAGGAPSGGMVSRLGASATCLRRNDGGGWVRLVEVVQPGGVAADNLRLLVFRHAGQNLVQYLSGPRERRLRVRIV